ncbi:protein PLASTID TRANSCRIPTIONALLY ACTIVE 7 isoform X2 [Amaranthus tricolor]|uniref:protein PLASTID TRANSCRIPTIONALLY ACTIVE 7 isoform X2 n=1 Tax=Amaranthus tricolor TaxID=29722 RepID=UPI00258B22A4|nr:protein PLASTID TRANSCRIPTIONALLY ACTIVE 7 isoform X2 [Amaranthus tricolor]
MDHNLIYGLRQEVSALSAVVTMPLSLSSPLFNSSSPLSSSTKFEVQSVNLRPLSFSIRSQDSSRSRSHRQSGRQVWRRRKLTKKDQYMEAKLERIPFLEEQIRKVTEGGGVLAGDLDRLLKSEDNRFAFVNEIAAEATAYVENNRDEYGDKKAILHVLSNRMNDAGFARSEAYMETDPFKPGPTYLKEEFT